MRSFLTHASAQLFQVSLLLEILRDSGSHEVDDHTELSPAEFRRVRCMGPCCYRQPGYMCCHVYIEALSSMHVYGGSDAPR